MTIGPEFVPNAVMGTGQAYDPVLLCLEFYRAAEPDNQAVNAAIFVPHEVYERMLDVHRKALWLLQDIEAVLDDPEHKLITSEARNLGHKLPNLEMFNQELDVYRRAVRDVEITPVERRGEHYVKVPIETVRSLNDLMKYNCFMVARIFDDCFNTEYMKQFSFYKKHGLPYQGPNALQSSVDVLVSMVKVVNAMESQIKQGIQRPDWPKLLTGTPHRRLPHAQLDLPAAE